MTGKGWMHLERENERCHHESWYYISPSLTHKLDAPTKNPSLQNLLICELLVTRNSSSCVEDRHAAVEFAQRNIVVQRLQNAHTHTKTEARRERGEQEVYRPGWRFPAAASH